jgi:hypothetical protein
MRTITTVISSTGHDDPVGHWVLTIQTAWQKSFEHIIETGRLLLEAKADKAMRGKFEEMIKHKLPFGRDAAYRLMAVAPHPVLSDVAHAPHLPPSWMTLYELTKLDDESLRAGLEDGSIRPGMERKDVAELRGIRRTRHRTATEADQDQREGQDQRGDHGGQRERRRGGSGGTTTTLTEIAQREITNLFAQTLRLRHPKRVAAMFVFAAGNSNEAGRFLGELAAEIIKQLADPFDTMVAPQKLGAAL